MRLVNEEIWKCMLELHSSAEANYTEKEIITEMSVTVISLLSMAEKRN
jgi:hypothetical protein